MCGGNENGIFDVYCDFWSEEKRNVIGVSMSRVADGEITGSHRFIEFSDGDVNQIRDKSFGWKWSDLARNVNL